MYLETEDMLMRWGYFQGPRDLECCCSVTGDSLPALIGASWMRREKLCLGVVRSRSFVENIDSLGAAGQLGDNVRLLVINDIGERTNEPAHSLVAHLAQAVGLEYHSAGNKTEFLKGLEEFLDTESASSPGVLEVFVDRNNDCAAERILQNI